MAWCLCACCNKEIQLETNIEFEECLLKFQVCDSLVNQLQIEDNWKSNYLLGQWFNRKEEFDVADSFYNKALKTQPSNLDLLIANVQNKISINGDQVDTIDALLKTLNPGNYKSSEYIIKLLILKARSLNRISKYGYRDASTLYAIYLAKKWNIETEFIYNPNYYNAIHLILEGNREMSLNHFNEAEKNTLDRFSPYYKLFLLYKLTEGMNMTVENIDRKTLEFISNEDYYFPSINSSIKLQIGYKTENRNESINKGEELINEQNVTELDAFFNIFYLIENLLKEDKIALAESYLSKLERSLDVREDLKFLTNYRKQEVSFTKYKAYCNNILESIFELNRITSKLAKESLSNQDNLHYADFIFNNNSNLFQTVYHGFQNNEKWISRETIITSLIQSKDAYDKIANLTNQISVQHLNRTELKRYSKLLQEIEVIELEVSNYQQTLSIDYSIFETLYKLYFDKYKIENQFPSKNNYLNTNDNTEYSNIIETIGERNIQILEITAAKNNYFFTFLNQDTVIIETHIKTEIDTLISRLLFDLNNKTHTKKGEYANRRLFALLQPYINSKYRDVIIIPDQNTSEIPFEVICISKDSNGVPIYFGELYNVSYDYSIKNILKKTKNISSETAVYSYSDNETIKNREYKIISELPFGLIESNEISQKNSKSKIFAGKSIKKDHILDNLDAPILHFSTHSSSNAENILDNYMYVRDEKGNPEKMYGFEIKHQKIDNSLVVLSSCNSGTGTYKPGAGVFSLSRDFLQAGAQTVIKSLWAVNEASTAELMVDFHRNFTQGYSASMSLTLAKRKLKQNPKYEHPYYWAGFVLEGNPNVYLDLEN